MAAASRDLIAQQQAIFDNAEEVKAASLMSAARRAFAALSPAAAIALMSALPAQPAPHAVTHAAPPAAAVVVGPRPPLDWAEGSQALANVVSFANHALCSLDPNGEPISYDTKVLLLHPDLVELFLTQSAPNPITSPKDALAWLMLHSPRQAFHPLLCLLSEVTQPRQIEPQILSSTSNCNKTALQSKVVGVQRLAAVELGKGRLTLLSITTNLRLHEDTLGGLSQGALVSDSQVDTLCVRWLTSTNALHTFVSLIAQLGVPVETIFDRVKLILSQLALVPRLTPPPTLQNDDAPGNAIVKGTYVGAKQANIARMFGAQSPLAASQPRAGEQDRPHDDRDRAARDRETASAPPATATARTATAPPTASATKAALKPLPKATGAAHARTRRSATGVLAHARLAATATPRRPLPPLRPASARPLCPRGGPATRRGPGPRTPAKLTP